ncbi:MAG: extracellular solute-binding protein, partial [Acidimicrobiia bacterium]
MPIDPHAPIPLYFQLKTLLLEEILEGRYPPGDRLPTEHELCALYGISRTPVHRALSELAEEGVILRHRRRGTFVNPHWLQRQPGRTELRIVVPDGSWTGLIREACPPDIRISVAQVGLPALHQTLTRAVAEGRAPDVAVLDSVWVAEFASSGFLAPLDRLDPELAFPTGDFLEPLASAYQLGGQTYALPAEVDVAGLWYSRRELERLGKNPPITWRELR